MEINVKLNVPAIEKLVDFTVSGIGSTASFFFSRETARHDAEVRVIAAKGDAEAQRVLAKGRATSMHIIAEAQAEARSKLISPQAALQGEVAIGELIEQRVQFQEAKRLANIGSVVAKAAQALGDREVQDHEVDHDWTARFFNDVQDVSSEEMQQLWAKVLAGEVDRPGQFSLRTLDALHDMSVGEAKLFAEACNYVAAERMIIYTDDMQFMDNNLHFSNILNLAELGLVLWHPNLTYIARWHQGDCHMTFHRGQLSFQGLPGSLNMTRLPMVRLTTVGRELFGLTEPQKKMDMLYLKLLAVFLKEHKIRLCYVEGDSIAEIDA